MRPVWDMTLAVFIGNFPVDDRDPDEMEAVFERYVNKHAAAWIPRSKTPLPDHPGFYLADIRGRSDDVALIQLEPKYSDFHLVGGYIDEFLWIDRGIRGRGLSPELVLAKVEKVGTLDPVSYTTAGRKAHMAAHRLAVQRALAESRAIPVSVRHEYPQLSKSQMETA